MEKLKRFLPRLAPAVLLIYLVIGILAYANVFPGSAAYFRSNSTSGIIFRAASTALICLYSLVLLVFRRNALASSWKWLIVFGFVLGCNLIVLFATKHAYSKLYVASLYGYLREISVSAGYKTLLTMYLSSVSDFALAFCFLFTLPFAFRQKKQLFMLCLPMVLFMIYECGWSIFHEWDQYKAIFTGETDIYGGYNLSIGATFGDKQEFGCFLTVGFCCALMSVWCLLRHKRWIALVAKVLLGASAAGFFVISFFTLCKTAILSNCLCLICVIAAFLVFLFKKHRTAFIISVGLLVVIIGLTTLILTVPALHESGPLNAFYKVVDTMFLSKVNKGIWSRFYIVKDYFNALSVPAFLFGLTKGGTTAFMTVAVTEGPGLHTGFVYFQACYGLLGSLLYAALFFIVIRNIVLCFKKNTTLGLLLVGLFVCTIAFNLSECEVLIVSGSAAIFPFNIMCVTFPAGYLKNEAA